MPRSCIQTLATILALAAAVAALPFACTLMRETPQANDPEVERFLAEYAAAYQPLYTASSEAQWKAVTDVSDEHTSASIAADQKLAEFTGAAKTITTVKEFLKRKDRLPELEWRQLEAILFAAAQNPGTIPDVVKERVEAEARQSEAMNGFVFRIARSQPADGVQVVTPNDIDEILQKSTDLDERRRAWESSKEVGRPLKDGLAHLQTLRNRVAREMGYPGYFSLMVAEYGMTSDEMIATLDDVIAELRPLYEQLHCYAKHKLAARYGRAVPQKIPAHWLPNRWGQEWPGLVDGIDLDPYFASWTDKQIVESAQAFYVSMGFPQLPQSFWEKSDLWALPAGAARKKNTHASAWHIDLDQDVRSLMSVKNNFEWFTTTHHELGHDYYYLSYARPEVPLVLREGANRAYHEGVGELISLAASQQSYLKDVGVLPKDAKIDQTQWLLNSAMTSVVLMPWSVGVMTHFERDLYDGNLPKDEFNARWWKYVAEFQGIEPPSPRGEEWCDAATKTHINDDPAAYYDYSLATILKFQLHEHIAKKILHQDVHDADYRNNKEVGAFLRGILAKGATEDWRKVLKDATGEEFSARAMLDYYRPLIEWLKRENAGADARW